MILLLVHLFNSHNFKLIGYAGKTDLDQARVDMIVACLLDIAQELMPDKSVKSEEEKVNCRQYPSIGLYIFFSLFF